MRQLYIRFLCLTILVIFSFESNSRYFSSISPFSVISDKTELDHSSKEKNHKIKRKVLSVKNEDKNRYINTLNTLPLKTISTKLLSTQLGVPLGPDPFMFTIVSSKESVNIGEEFELTVRVSWLDFGINNGVRFQPEWYKYTLKVVMPDGFVQTGGNYEDYCTAPVNAENPTATFTIKGHFEFEPKEPTFKVLRGFEGFNEKSEFIWKGESQIIINNCTISRNDFTIINHEQQGLISINTKLANYNDYEVLYANKTYQINTLIKINNNENYIIKNKLTHCSYQETYKNRIGTNLSSARLQADKINNITANAEPFCTSNINDYIIPVASNEGVGEGSNYPAIYQCLGGVPRPHWYYFKAKEDGTLDIQITGQYDVDFACWGPFDTKEQALNFSNLTATNVKSCSFTTAATENCRFSGAIKGKYYTLIVTKYSPRPMTITFKKNGGIDTDCDVVCDIPTPIIDPQESNVNCENCTTILTAKNCDYQVKWYNSSNNELASGIKLDAPVGTYYATCTRVCSDGTAKVSKSLEATVKYKKICSTVGFGPAITNNSTGQIPNTDKTFCESGTVSLSVSGCYDNSKAIWYDTFGNFLANGSTYSSTINSNQTFAVSCENHCEPPQRLGWETINFTVIPYDQCHEVNPQLVNKTPGGVTEFCGNGQFSVLASGCPDGNRVKWWVGDGSTVQGSEYVANITTTTWVSFRCISPVTGDLIGPEKYLIFTVKSFSDCNYAPAIINNTPGKKTVFCTKGWVDLTVTGCPNNNLARWYTDGTELNGGIGSTVRGTITRTSKIGVTCLNPNDNTDFGWNEITFKVDNSGCDANNPTIINNTTHGYNKFCKKGWVSLEVDGCPDNNKAKWYKNNTFVKQSAIYNEVINQTATYKVTCENPAYESAYSEMKFEVLTNGDCYIPSVVNLTPNGQTDFCGSGILKLMISGCNTNYPPAFEEHIDGKPVRSFGGTWEMIDGVNTSVLNYNATESGYIKVICRTNESQNDYIWASQQIVKFKVNPVPIISASNTAACVGTPFSLSAIVPNIPINRGDIKFEWTNANNIAIGSQQNISLLAANSTPTTYNVKFTNNKGCSATTSTVVTNYALPVVTVANSSITQCAGTLLNLNANSTVGSGKATIQVKLAENTTGVDRSVQLTIAGTMTPTPSTITITQKAKTSTSCVKCKNTILTDGQVIGYRDDDKFSDRKAIIKIENGCAKAWWYDFNEPVHPDWIPYLKNQVFPDSILQSCINFEGFNNCVNDKACDQGENSGITNFTSAGGITSFEISLPSVNGTWTITRPSATDKNWISFVNALPSATTLIGGSNINYNWTKGTTFKSTLQNPSIGNIQVSDAGTYKVEVTDVRNCVGSTTVNVVVNPLPDPTVSAASTTTFCQGGSVILSAVTGMTSYQWKKDGVNIAGATSQTYTATSSGVYTIQVTNSNNCSNTSTVANGKTVTVNTIPTIVITGSSKVCAGQAVTLAVTGANTYSWTGPNSFTSTSATPSIASATTASTGIYTVVGTSTAGCTKASTFSVVVIGTPVVTVTSNSPAEGLTTGETLNLAYTSNPAITPISHKWTFNPDTVALGTNATHNIANVYEAHGGTYKIVIEHDAEKKCKAYGTLLVKIKPFVCKLTAVAEPTCYIETNKRWAKLKVTIKDRTKIWKGSIKVQRVKDVDGNLVASTEPALINYQWQGLTTTTEELPLKDKILDGIYAITLNEKRSDTDTGPTVSCNPEVLYVTVGCQRKCQKDLQPCLTGDCCGIPATINLNNEIKLEQLIVGDTIKANDFKIIISKVNQVSAGSYTWNIEGISKVPVFDNVFLGLKSDVPVVFNECKELVSGTITTLYNPVNWDKPIQAKAIAKAIYESAKEVIDDIVNAIGIKVDMNKDDLANIAQQLREQAGKDLPKELETKAIEAARKLEEARDDYAKAKAAGNSTAMTAASAKFDEARAEIAALKADTDKYLALYQRIVQLTLEKMWTQYQSTPDPVTTTIIENEEAQPVDDPLPLAQSTFLTEAQKTTIVNSFKTDIDLNLKLVFKYFIKVHKGNASAIKDLEQKIKVYEKTTDNSANQSPSFTIVDPVLKLSDYIYQTMCKSCTASPDANEQAMIKTTEKALTKRIKEIFKTLVYTQN